MITLHASGTSTSRMAFRLSRLAMDREPRVATSLVLYCQMVSGQDFVVVRLCIPDCCDSVLGRGQDCFRVDVSL